MHRSTSSRPSYSSLSSSLVFPQRTLSIDSFDSQGSEAKPSSPRNKANLTVALTPAMRKRKNADAQAAFRVRRALYIKSLEEAVTKFEGTVRDLQISLQEERDKANELRHENTRLNSKLEGMQLAERERERMWKALETKGVSRPHGVQNADLGSQSTGIPPTLPTAISSTSHQSTPYSNWSSGFESGAYMTTDYHTNATFRVPHTHFGTPAPGLRIMTMASNNDPEPVLASPAFHTYRARSTFFTGEASQNPAFSEYPALRTLNNNSHQSHFSSETRASASSLPHLKLDQPISPSDYTTSSTVAPSPTGSPLAYVPYANIAASHCYNAEGGSDGLSGGAYGYDSNVHGAIGAMQQMGLTRLDDVAQENQDTASAGQLSTFETAQRGRQGLSITDSENVESARVKRPASDSRCSTPRPAARVRRDSPSRMSARNLEVGGTPNSPIISDTLAVIQARTFGSSRHRNRASRASEKEGYAMKPNANRSQAFGSRSHRRVHSKTDAMDQIS